MSDITSVPPAVSNMLDEVAPMAPADTAEPMYRVDPATKIPVSKHYGKLWEGRITATQSSRKHHVDAWDEAVRYYNNDQLNHREGGKEGRSGNRYFASRRNTQWSETENLVYANTRSIMPALYAKNPQAEFTASIEEVKQFVQLIEDMVNTLAPQIDAPGLNLKVVAKQAVLAAELCNLGWFEYGYTEKGNDSAAAQITLDELSQALIDAKDSKSIREIEGKLMALEEELSNVTPPGPFVRYKPPHDVLVDGDCSMPDFSDAKWMAINEVYPTDYLNARYGEKQEDGSIKSIYEPTHVMMGGESGEDDIKNFSLFKGDAAASEYGYRSTEALRKAYRTKCWRIWDKTTRRVFLYADNKWDWPVWVENDPYGLPGFFPLRALYFNTTPIGAMARSNVTYYLDQQDGINEIHDEFRRARKDTKDNILYDDSFARESVVDWIRGSGPNAQGVTIPEGRKLSDMVMPKPNSMISAMPLFDPQRLFQSIDRVSGVSDVLRNAQFKTNTTNKAIENYNSSTAMRLDEKIDAIEEALGYVMYNIGFLCAQFMPPEEAVNILGPARAEGWVNHTATELRRMFTCQAVGGSTQKPTSEAKKQQAIEVSKLLAQMIQFAPTVVLETTLTLFQDAFDELTLPRDAFARIKEEATMALQRGNSDSGGAPNASAGNGGMGGGDPGAADAGASPNGSVDIQQLAKAIDQLPPEAKLALGKVLAQGVPIAQALPEVLRMTSNSKEANNGNA